MVEVPDEAIAQRVIDEAREWGEYDVPRTFEECDLEWSMADISPEECDVELNSGEIIVHADIEASFSYRTSRGSHWHPPEYATETVPLHLTIEWNVRSFDTPVTVYGEVW